MKAKALRKSVSPASQKIGFFFGKFGSPNFYTGLTFVFGLITAFLIASGEIIPAIIAFALSGFFDWVDGAVARTQKKTSKFGIIFDSTVDKVTETTIYLGFAWFAFELYWPAVLALTAFLLSSYESKIGYEINTHAQGGIAERRERFILLIIALLLLFVNTGMTGILLYFMALLSGITALQRFFWIKKQSQKQ